MFVEPKLPAKRNLRNTTACEIRWNPVNMDTKGTRQSARIMWVSVLSGLSEKLPDTRFIERKTKADMLMATKRFVAATSAN